MSSLITFYRWLHGVAKLFRFAELCLCVCFFRWFSAQLPFAVRISGEYFRRTFLMLSTPVCIFLLGNAIVVTLLAKSGLFASAAEADGLPEQEEPVFHDEEITYGEKKNNEVEEEAVTVAAADVVDKVASYRRSKSENMRGSVKKLKLRRSETDVIRRSDAADAAAAAVRMTAEDAEDFQRTIEAFIAKQMRFHREERLAVVWPSLVI